MAKSFMVHEPRFGALVDCLYSLFDYFGIRPVHLAHRGNSCACKKGSDCGTVAEDPK